MLNVIIGLAPIFLFMMYKVVKNLDPPALFTKTPTKFDTESELAPGIPRATTTLAHLLVSEMLRNLDVKGVKKTDTRKTEAGGYSHGGHLVTEFIFPSFRVNERNTNGIGLSYSFFVDGVSVHGDFNDAERGILREGFKKFLSLKEVSEKERREYEAQQRAIDAIAKIMGVEQDKEEEKDVQM
jgi:hypothetical protein